MSNCYIPQIHLFLYLWFGFIVLVSLPSIIHIVVHRILFFYALHIFMNKSYVLDISLWVIYGLFLYMFLHIFYFIYHFLLLSWDLDARKISQNSINQNVSKTHRGGYNENFRLHCLLMEWFSQKHLKSQRVGSSLMLLIRSSKKLIKYNMIS